MALVLMIVLPVVVMGVVLVALVAGFTPRARRRYASAGDSSQMMWKDSGSGGD